MDDLEKDRKFVNDKIREAYAKGEIAYLVDLAAPFDKGGVAKERDSEGRDSSEMDDRAKFGGYDAVHIDQAILVARFNSATTRPRSAGPARRSPP